MIGETGTEGVKGGQASTGKMMEDLRALVNDAQELLNATANQTGELIAGARAKAEESLKAAKTWLSEGQESVKSKSREACQFTEEYVKSNPWTAVGIAVGAGFLIGFISVLAARREPTV
jgi:ElaB/YqjD/DUF883 family membrane-anchored ribosome-binding protein